MRANIQNEAEFMRHDQKSHHTLLALTGNKRLVLMVEGLRDQTRAVRIAADAGSPTVLATMADERPAILSHIENGDVTQAARAMTEHLSTVERLLLAQSEHAEAAVAKHGAGSCETCGCDFGPIRPGGLSLAAMRRRLMRMRAHWEKLLGLPRRGKRK
jgi:DNA-binding FadR family transcriptional regulator